MTTTELGPSLGADPAWLADQLEAALRLQRVAALKSGPASRGLRRERLDRLMAALLSSTEELADAVGLDFGNRPRAATLAGEIAMCINDIVGFRRNVGRWMKSRRPQPLYFRLAGIRAWVEPSPLGVVGVIAPWNFPIALALQPVAAAIAAGNSVMLKMSEITPHTADVMREAIAAHFEPEEFVVVTGGPDVGGRFSALPFDHLFFTGSAPAGAKVALAAAKNLVPVTLELGGKNPTVVGRDADLPKAARRIARARLANSGQICLRPDYVFVPRETQAQFLAAAQAAFREAVPTILDNRDYCSIVNNRHYQRITKLVTDAVAKGADIIEVIPDGERFPSPQTRRIPPTLLSRITPDMRIMHEEIFGPVLPVLPYDAVGDVIRHVNEGPAPLAVYWFGGDSGDFRAFKASTRSGGVSRNDFALHAAVDGLPFGGVGKSGSGYYHGKFGFDTFSHLRAVAESPRLFSPVSMLSPSFSARLERALTWFFERQQARVRKRVDSTADTAQRGTK